MHIFCGAIFGEGKKEMKRRNMCEICQSRRCPVSCPGYGPLRRRKRRGEDVLWEDGDFQFVEWEALRKEIQANLCKRRSLLNNKEMRMESVGITREMEEINGKKFGL